MVGLLTCKLRIAHLLLRLWGPIHLAAEMASVCPGISLFSYLLSFSLLPMECFVDSCKYTEEADMN